MTPGLSSQSSVEITIPAKKPRKLPKAPEDKHIPAHNCCSLCLYNIPSGSLMILIPGLVLLLTGIVVMSWTESDASWNADLTTASLIFLIIGAILTLGSITYWCYMWVKYRPKVTNKRKTISPRSGHTVELVSIQQKYNPSEVYHPPDVGDRIVTIS